ncbi:hypothetical protein [Streptomyces gardneri]|uniref:hypothetical protein n=1 Tax=Streptomyces gardneri TaxID=66892 RepID=UPI0033ECC462
MAFRTCSCFIVVDEWLSCRPLAESPRRTEAAAEKPAELPAPVAEKRFAADRAVRGAGVWLWTAVRDRKTLVSTTAAVTAAAVGAYVLWSQAGRCSEARSPGSPPATTVADLREKAPT